MKAVLACALACGCTGQVGTIDITLATAPGSHVLDSVQTLKLVVTNPHQVTTATRDANGHFTIGIDLAATGEVGALIVDGLDATGATVATGATPPFPIGALTAEVAIYMAAPNTIAEAPHSLAPARTDLAIAPLSYGAVIAGGRDAALAPSDAIAIYNAFDHTLSSGVALPAPRDGLAIGIGSNHYVYLFGGRDATGAPAGNLWRFDTSIAPAGGFLDLGAQPTFARAGETMIGIGNDHFLVTGGPPAELSGLEATMIARDDVPALPPGAVAVTASDGVATAIFAGETQGYRFRNNTFVPLDAPDALRPGASAVALPGGKVGVVCGGPGLVRIDAATGTAETIANIPADPRSGCAVAATTQFLVIAGGTRAADGTVATTAEIYNAATLALVATQPLVAPRTGATAMPLPNGQILIASGTDSGGAPVATLELFTPESAE